MVFHQQKDLIFLLNYPKYINYEARIARGVNFEVFDEFFYLVFDLFFYNFFYAESKACYFVSSGIGFAINVLGKTQAELKLIYRKLSF